jgi:hypothetical protein
MENVESAMWDGVQQEFLLSQHVLIFWQKCYPNVVHVWVCENIR